MPTNQFPDNPSPEVAAERERALYLISVVTRLPQCSGRAMTALTQGYTREECEQRWGAEFKL